MVLQIKTKPELEAKLKEAGNRLVIIDFSATWCGPCKIIAPKLDELQAERPHLVVLKIDVDESEDLAAEYEINAMPTFILIKEGKKLESFAGANYEKLVALVDKHQ